MKFKIVIIMGVCLSYVAVANAQSRQWSLENCIDYGLSHHISLKVQENAVKIAEQKARETLSAYLPQVVSSINLDDNLKRQASIIPAGYIGPDAVAVRFGTHYSSIANGTIDQVVYDQSMLTGLKAGRYQVRQAQLSGEVNKEIVTYNIETGYYQVFIYKQQSELLLENKKNYDRQLAVIELRVNKGIAVQADLERMQVTLNNTLSQVNLAQSNYEVALGNLKNFMGLQPEDSLAIKPIDVAKVTDVPAVGASSFQVTNRNDYQLQQVAISLAGIEERRIRQTGLPRLTAYGRYSDQAQGDQLSTYTRNWGDFSTIGLKLSVSVFDGFKRNAQYKQALYNKMNAEETLLQDAHDFTTAYNNSEIALTKARANLESDLENLELSKSVLATSTLQYQGGTAVLSDWLNSTISQNDAQRNYLTSLYNYLMARLDLEKAKGNLLDYSKN